MIKLNQAVIVEGKYDKIKLQSVLNALIITTEGFAVFKDKEKQRLIRNLAEKRGIIIMTDSDSAGFMIRSFIGSCVPRENIINVYIPDVFGKERRKTKAGCEGKLGVEGMSAELLLEALEKAGVRPDDASPDKRSHITRMMLYEDGFIGREDSRDRRQQLKQRLELPEHLQSNALPEVLSCLLSQAEYRSLADEINQMYCSG